MVAAPPYPRAVHTGRGRWVPGCHRGSADPFTTPQRPESRAYAEYRAQTSNPRRVTGCALAEQLKTCGTCVSRVRRDVPEGQGYLFFPSYGTYSSQGLDPVWKLAVGLRLGWLAFGWGGWPSVGAVGLWLGRLAVSWVGWVAVPAVRSAAVPSVGGPVSICR